jgi:hypothetical protein
VDAAAIMLSGLPFAICDMELHLATINLALVGTPPSNCTLLKVTAVYVFRTPSSGLKLLCMFALIYCTEQGIIVVKHGRK